MRSIFPKAGWMLAGVLALYVLAALAGAVTGGPLDPPGAPAPTGTTLGQIPGAWARLLDSTNGRDPDNPGCSSDRFECVFPRGVGCNPICIGVTYDGVLDHETGLVWERTPSTEIKSWFAAMFGCIFGSTGGRYGWRLPTLIEFLTLAAATATPDGLPDGHPFIGATGDDPTDLYWTGMSDFDAGTPSTYVLAYNVSDPGSLVVAQADFHVIRAWCVRGGAGSHGEHIAVPAP